MMIQDILAQPVVVFSKNYLPINRINVKRAIILLVTEKAEPLQFDSDREKMFAIHSPTSTYFVPQNIRLTVAHHERRGWKIPAVNRREVLRRDKHCCQYCGSTKSLTIDHVIPRSRGGKHTWDNVVAACESCNSRKGNRTPEEAQMKLRHQPKTPVHPAVSFAEEFWRSNKLSETIEKEPA